MVSVGIIEYNKLQEKLCCHIHPSNGKIGLSHKACSLGGIDMDTLKKKLEKREKSELLEKANKK